MTHLISVIEIFKDKGVGFRSLSDGSIDTTTASGELVFNIFSSMAQFERCLISSSQFSAFLLALHVQE